MTVTPRSRWTRRSPRPEAGRSGCWAWPSDGTLTVSSGAGRLPAGGSRRRRRTVPSRSGSSSPSGRGRDRWAARAAQRPWPRRARRQCRGRPVRAAVELGALQGGAGDVLEVLVALRGLPLAGHRDLEQQDRRAGREELLRRVREGAPAAVLGLEGGARDRPRPRRCDDALTRRALRPFAGVGVGCGGRDGRERRVAVGRRARRSRRGPGMGGGPRVRSASCSSHSPRFRMRPSPTRSGSGQVLTRSSEIRWSGHLDVLVVAGIGEVAGEVHQQPE